jgi:hypothetical protein
MRGLSLKILAAGLAIKMGAAGVRKAIV